MKHTRDTVAGEPAHSAVSELSPLARPANLKPVQAQSPGANGPGLSGAAAEQAIATPRLVTLPRPHVPGGLKVSTLSYLNMHEFGDLLSKSMMVRKQVFIDTLEWDLPNVDNMEFDQYDTPMCRWVIVHEFGEVLAGIRLVPTTAVCGTYSYMLRDGQLGLLKDFPTDIMFFEAPVTENIWEASRLFIAEDVPAQHRSQVQSLLMREMILAAADEDAKHVIGIVPAVWSRWLRRLGLYAVPIGPRFTIGRISSQAALFSVADQLDWALGKTDTPAS